MELTQTAENNLKEELSKLSDLSLGNLLTKYKKETEREVVLYEAIARILVRLK